MLVVFPVLAQVAGFELPRELRFALVVAFVVAVVFILGSDAFDKLCSIGWISATLRRWEMMLVVLSGALIGAVVAPWIWNRVKPDELAHSISNAEDTDSGPSAASETNLLTKPIVGVDGANMDASAKPELAIEEVQQPIPTANQETAAESEKEAIIVERDNYKQRLDDIEAAKHREEVQKKVRAEFNAALTARDSKTRGFQDILLTGAGLLRKHRDTEPLEGPQLDEWMLRADVIIQQVGIEMVERIHVPFIPKQMPPHRIENTYHGKFSEKQKDMMNLIDFHIEQLESTQTMADEKSTQ